MPKQKSLKLGIHLDLLRPQSNPEQLLTKLLRWLLSTGRYIFVFVEALVLIVFIARFKLDEELALKKETIESQIPYIESLKPFELLARQTQLKLTTISSLRRSGADYPLVLKNIADQTPMGITIGSIRMEKTAQQVIIQLNGIAPNNGDLANFLSGLKQEPLLSDVSITSVGFDKGSLNFSITAKSKASAAGSNL